MHIPTCDTARQEILPFDRALDDARRPNPDYDVNRWLYVPSMYCDYRYILGTAGEKPLICVGINPSTAAPNDLDNTLKSVERIALANGYDSFIMFNVYAQRATRPDDMATRCFIGKTWRHSAGRWNRPGPARPPCGPPGGRSLKNAPTWRIAWGI